LKTEKRRLDEFNKGIDSNTFYFSTHHDKERCIGQKEAVNSKLCLVSNSNRKGGLSRAGSPEENC
jgi:hypothetical protein